jgi:hypothetical protein
MAWSHRSPPRRPSGFVPTLERLEDRDAPVSLAGPLLPSAGTLPRPALVAALAAAGPRLPAAGDAVAVIVRPVTRPADTQQAGQPILAVFNVLNLGQQTTVAGATFDVGLAGPAQLQDVTAAPYGGATVTQSGGPTGTTFQLTLPPHSFVAVRLTLTTPPGSSGVAGAVGVLTLPAGLTSPFGPLTQAAAVLVRP